jgi:hypothetical protein
MSEAIREEFTALITTLIGHGKTGNLRAVIQTLEKIEKRAKDYKENLQLAVFLAKAYRHALEPLGVAKKYKDVEKMIAKIEEILKLFPENEALQEVLSEALDTSIFHYSYGNKSKLIEKSLKRLGSFACNHQKNPFVQFNYAHSLSLAAKYHAENENKEYASKVLWEIIGIVTFFPGNEILAQVADGLFQCITLVGPDMNLNQLKKLTTHIDEFVNFTNEFEIQQKLTACQGKLFQYIAGRRMREGLSPDGTEPIKRR